MINFSKYVLTTLLILIIPYSFSTIENHFESDLEIEFKYDFEVKDVIVIFDDEGLAFKAKNKNDDENNILISTQNSKKDNIISKNDLKSQYDNHLQNIEDLNIFLNNSTSLGSSISTPKISSSSINFNSQKRTKEDLFKLNKLEKLYKQMNREIESIQNNDKISNKEEYIQNIQNKYKAISYELSDQTIISFEKTNIEISQIYTNLFLGIAIENLDKQTYEELKNNFPKYKFFESISFKQSITNETRDVLELTQARTIVNGTNLTGRGVKVAVIDSGIDFDHPDFGNCSSSKFLNNSCSKFLGGYDFVNSDNDPSDDNGHGTHVASILSSNNSNTQLQGVAPGSQLYIYKVLDDQGNGNGINFLSALDRSLDPNSDLDFSDKVDIVSISLGAATSNPNNILSLRVDNISNLGIIPVLSAGNNGSSGFFSLSSPASSREAITVGASYKDAPNIDTIATFSSSGPTSIGTLKPDIIAPGVDICAALSSTHYGPAGSSCQSSANHHHKDGTSMAAPIVSGIVALLLEENSSLNTKQVKAILRNSATDINQSIPRQGWGRVNPLKAINLTQIPCQVEINSSSFTSIQSFENSLNLNFSLSCPNIQNYSVYVNSLDSSYNIVSSTFIDSGNSTGKITLNSDTSQIGNGTYLISIQAYDSNSNYDGVDYILMNKEILTPGLINTCGEITRNGSYTLNSNLNASQSALTNMCFEINTNHVEIDCNGYSIFGSAYNDANTAISSTNGYSNVSIVNCNFENIGKGIDLDSIDNKLLIENISIDNVGSGITIKNGNSNITLQNIYLNHSLINGFEIEGLSGNLIIDNVSINHSLKGFLVSSLVSPYTLIQNINFQNSLIDSTLFEMSSIPNLEFKNITYYDIINSEITGITNASIDNINFIQTNTNKEIYDAYQLNDFYIEATDTINVNNSNINLNNLAVGISKFEAATITIDNSNITYIELVGVFDVESSTIDFLEINSISSSTNHILNNSIVNSIISYEDTCSNYQYLIIENTTSKNNNMHYTLIGNSSTTLNYSNMGSLILCDTNYVSIQDTVIEGALSIFDSNSTLISNISVNGPMYIEMIKGLTIKNSSQILNRNYSNFQFIALNSKNIFNITINDSTISNFKSSFNIINDLATKNNNISISNVDIINSTYENIYLNKMINLSLKNISIITKNNSINLHSTYSELISFSDSYDSTLDNISISYNYNLMNQSLCSSLGCVESSNNLSNILIFENDNSITIQNINISNNNSNSNSYSNSNFFGKILFETSISNSKFENITINNLPYNITINNNFNNNSIIGFSLNSNKSIGIHTKTNSTNISNSIFYNNYFDISLFNILENTTFENNLFNTTINNLNIGNYWSNFSCINSSNYGNGFKVCNQIVNETLSSKNIIDNAPLVEPISEISYSSITPNSVFGTVFKGAILTLNFDYPINSVTAVNNPTAGAIQNHNFTFFVSFDGTSLTILAPIEYGFNNYTFTINNDEDYQTIYNLPFTANLALGGAAYDLDDDGINDTEDKVFGNTSNVATNVNNLSLEINGSTNLSQNFNDTINISFKKGDQVIVAFTKNLTSNILNLTQVQISEENKTNNSKLLISGLTLDVNTTKTIYLDLSGDTTVHGSLCLKDSHISGFGDISANCNSTNETYVQSIPSNINGYNISYINSSNQTIEIIGLIHSAVSQVCTENWSYGSWSTCSGGTQTRTATDSNNCGTTSSREVISQSCTSSSSSGGGSSGGGGGGGSSSSSRSSNTNTNIVSNQRDDNTNQNNIESKSIILPKELSIENSFKILIDGESIDLNTNINEEKIISLESQNSIIKFNHDFNKSNLDLENVEIEVNSSNNRNYVIISNLNLQESSTKSITMPKSSDSNLVCIKDSKINSIDEISEFCNNENEVILNCELNTNSIRYSTKYSCIIENNSYIISGLKHSGVIEYSEKVVTLDDVRNEISNVYDLNSNNEGILQGFKRLLFTFIVIILVILLGTSIYLISKKKKKEKSKR